MRHFNGKFNLATAPRGIKIVTTLFLFFVVPGFVSNVLISQAKTGWSQSGMVEYYRGVESGYPKTYLELLETSHFHLFSMSVIFLILAHLFLMSTWSDRSKIIVIVLSFLGMILEIACPWLITYVYSGFATLMIFSGIAISITLILYIVVPIYEMWFMKVANNKE